MKNEKLMSAASVFGWFGVYLLISIFSFRLPVGLDCAVTILALWGLVIICARTFGEKRTLPEMLSYGGISKVPPLWLMLAFCAGAGLNLAFSGLLPLLPLPESLVDTYANASAQYEKPTNAQMFKTVFLVPILEETVFRGLIGDRLGRIAPKCLALPIASLIFAVMHVGILWSSYAFLSGLLLTGMYYYCRSILPCIAFHLAFNASNYLWAKILHLPDETWGYAVSLAIGAVICTVFSALLFTVKSKEKRL